MMAHSTEFEREILRKTEFRNAVGGPITVSVHGIEVDLDYLMAAQEVAFIQRYLGSPTSVLEIGAGYGRTCHTLMSVCDIEKYVIADLPDALTLAKNYLRLVLDPSVCKNIHFVDVTKGLEPGPCTLAINIDSFHEMDAASVKDYFALIDANCRCFYTKNPVGKYRLNVPETDEVRAALTAGLLTDVVNIWDGDAVNAECDKFVEAYRPGEHWKSCANERAKPWSFYWQAGYVR